MRKILRFNIQIKITLIIIAVVLPVLLGVYQNLKITLQAQSFNIIRSHLLKEGKLVKSFVENYLSEKRTIAQIDSLADQIGSDLDIRVTIIDLKGFVLGDSQLEKTEVEEIENHLKRPEVQDAIKSGIGVSRRFSTTIKKDMLYLAYPFNANGANGMVRVSITLSDIQIITNRLNKSLVFSLFMAFVFSSLIGYIASIYISKPIKRIACTAQAIAAGNFTKKIYLNANDELQDLSVAFNDMVDQIKVKIDEISSSRSRFEAMLLSMFEGVVVIDEHCKIILINETLLNVLQIEKDPSDKKPIEIIRNVEIQNMADEILRKNSSVQTKEIVIISPTEKIFQVHATPIVIRNENKGAILVFHDITELRRLENIRRDFVANVSHELRTPITNIKGYSETLLDGAIDDKENLRDFIEIINSDAHRLAQLVEDLLDLSKIESGRIELFIEPCKITDILNEVLNALAKKIETKKINITVNIDNDMNSVNVDKKSIAQVFLNLVDNAVKYNKDAGNVDISARRKETFVEISIKDTGIGIPKEDIPRIFERFYRVDKARSRKLGGTGLGLSIAKHILLAHGCSIEVSSEIDLGTTFTFILPAA